MLYNIQQKLEGTRVYIDAETKLYLLIGNPVGHSLSPALHNAAFKALNLNCVYLAASVEAGSVAGALSGFRALNIAGANVTSPHKEAVIAHLDQVSEEARALSSVNTIVNNNGRLSGMSTDGAGFIRAVENSDTKFKGSQPVMVVGAGGAARTVAYNLAVKGTKEMHLINRSLSKAQALSDILLSKTPLKKCHLESTETADFKGLLKHCRMVIYTLPLDLPGFAKALQKVKELPPDSCLFDLRYSPPVTAVMQEYEKAGGTSYNGAGMLYWQAVEAFRIFTGREAPLQVMRRALNELN
jgi:shikimate dehydrogenase